MEEKKKDQAIANSKQAETVQMAQNLNALKQEVELEENDDDDEESPTQSLAERPAVVKFADVPAVN